MSIKQTIKWQFIKEKPAANIIEKWQEICRNSNIISASSTPTFAFNADRLVNANVFYALGFLNKQLVTALPLVIKSKVRFGVTIQYLQIAIHDHLDYFVAAGQSELSEKDLIDSLISACRDQVNGWHWFFSRRWFIRATLDKNLLSQSYQRQAAYFDLSDKHNINAVISKKLLKNLNRFEKKLNECDQQLELTLISNEDQILESLESFYTIESAGWKGKAGSAISQSVSLKAFYDECWKAFSKTGNARLFELKQNNTPIAACIAYQHKNNIFLHKIAYDESLSKLSPGSILVKKIIEQCIEQTNVTKLCFNTNPPWVQRWHPQFDELYAVQSFNSNVKGFMIRLAVQLYYLLRKIKRRIQKRD